MKLYKGIPVVVTEGELKFTNGRFAFGAKNPDATGFERARLYMSRPLNKDSDARIYGVPHSIVKGSIGNRGGRSSNVFADFHSEAATFAAIDYADAVAHRGGKAALGISCEGCLKVTATTDSRDYVYSKTWKDKPWSLDLPDCNGLKDVLKSLEGRSEAKYKAAGKAWELAVFDRLRELKKTDPNIVDVFYVGSLEDQREHDLQQACDILIYSLAPLM